MKDDNTNKESDSKFGLSPNPFAPKPPTNKTPQERSRDNVNMIAASQFAYTLTIGTLLFGFAGMWLGNKLGGAPWNVILMLLFGSLAFVGEVYRMYIMFTPKKPTDDKSAKKDSKNGAANGSTDGGVRKDGTANGGANKDVGKSGAEGDAEHDCGCDEDSNR